MSRCRNPCRRTRSLGTSRSARQARSGSDRPVPPAQVRFHARRCEMAATREARAVWTGDLLSGNGVVSGGSRKFNDLPISWGSRTEAPAGRTSPEELLAAGHASCFAMALSADLARAGLKPERLEVGARVTFDKVADKWTVVSSELEVKGTVAGADAARFAQAAEGAKDNCPISRALKGNVKLTVKPTLST